jgi:hypothetical protein
LPAGFRDEKSLTLNSQRQAGSETQNPHQTVRVPENELFSFGALANYFLSLQVALNLRQLFSICLRSLQFGVNHDHD